MGVREFEALGPMLRAVASGPKRCAGDVLLFGPRGLVEEFYRCDVEAVAPVDGAEWGALLTGLDLLGRALRAEGRGGVAARMVELQAGAPAGANVAVEWRGSEAPDVHLLVERPAAEASVAPAVAAAPLGPRVFPSEVELVEACAEGAAASSVIVVASSSELRRVLGPDARPVGFVAARDVGAAVAPPGVLMATLPAADFDALSAAQSRRDGARLVLWGAPGSRVVSRVEDYAAALGAESTARAWTAQAAEAARRAGSGRLVGEGEQRAAVAWAERLAPPHEVSSDVVVMAWGDAMVERLSEPSLRLPHVGSVARPWFFEGAVRALLEFRPRFAPQAPRVAFFVGAVLCRVWTATGGSVGGPALVRLDEGERRADVLRPDEGAGEDE